MGKRQRRRSKRGRRNNGQAGQIHQLTDAIRDQTLLIQTRTLPMQRDKIPMPLPRVKHVFTTTRKAPLIEIYADSAGTTGATAFTLDTLTGYTEFTALFDQYRIIEIRASFNPMTAAFGPSTTTTDLPMLYTVIDFDDAATPANIDELRQFSTCQATSYRELQFRCFTPQFALAAYGGAFTSYSQSRTGAWNDCNSPSIQYYGLKWAISPVTVVSSQYLLYNVDITYVLQFRCTR